MAGFMATVVNASIIGGAAWIGLTQATTKSDIVAASNEIKKCQSDCAVYGRDFVNYGFETAPGKDKNAYDLWMASFTQMENTLKELAARSSTGVEEDREIEKLLQVSAAYRSGFMQMAEARRRQDQACTDWAGIGAAVTERIGVARNQLDPLLKAAVAAGDLESHKRWADIALAFERQVINPFVQVRVMANRYVRTAEDSDFTAYANQMTQWKESLMAWADSVANTTELGAAAQSIRKDCDIYSDQGKTYTQAVQGGKAANTSAMEAFGAITE